MSSHEQQLVPALAAVLDVPQETVRARRSQNTGDDLLVIAAGVTFAVDLISTISAGVVAVRAARAAAAAKRLRPRATPLVAVPFMTETGRAACAAVGVSWFDLSGNAHIVTPRLRVLIEGKPNKFRQVGRPTSVFAPKSARIVRWLLLNPSVAFTQLELALATGLTQGFVSQIVAQLEAQSYVTRDDEPSATVARRGKAPIRVRDPDLLLDAWAEEYRFDKHAIFRGHIAARSGDALARQVSDALNELKVEHAATGLAAAWQMDHFASFRTATFYVAEPPSAGLMELLRFRADPRGSNTWIVVPNDAGIFHGAEPRDGIRCVSAVQAYLDLKHHSERAKEAAEHLRSNRALFGFENAAS